MDKLTEDQSAIVDAARQFTLKEIEPIANAIDESEAVPAELTKKIGEQGFYGLVIPSEYGGLGLDTTTACLVVEEIAKASPSLAGLLSVQIVLCPMVVMDIGNEEQKRRLLPLSATGERLLAYSQSEPAGAVNYGAHLTKLTRTGNDFRLNGAKLFCSQGEAVTYLVMCKTEQDDQQGYGCVIVEAEMPGFSKAPHDHKLGWRGTNTGSISFDEVTVPPENVLGNMLTAKRDMFLVANQASFLGHAASSLGCAQGMFDKTLAYVKDRTLYGAPMARVSGVADKLGAIWARLQAMRAMLYGSAEQFDAGRADKMLGVACKAWICDEAFRTCSELLQLWGGSGIMNATGVHRYFRDARTNMIAEGATEIHHDIIAKLVLGLG